MLHHWIRSILITVLVAPCAVAATEVIPQPNPSVMNHMVEISKAWTHDDSTAAPYYGANCAGATLLGLGLKAQPTFVPPTQMDTEILPNCFAEVSIPHRGDIAAFQIDGKSFHFNLVIEGFQSFNKMDIGAKYSFLNPDDPYSCVTAAGTKKSYCRLFRYVGGPSCDLKVN